MSNESKPEPISQIRQEYKRLQEVESLLIDIWQCEVQAYEHNDEPATSNDVALDTSAATSYGGHRNHPNSEGKVTDPIVFPYHDSLYPLLDCYDSIEHEGETSNVKDDVVPPSEAPNPFAHNGYRRSKFSRRSDPRGFHIEEVEFLDGHLPNSACAIREAMMPPPRKIDYMEYIMDQDRNERSMDNVIEIDFANQPGVEGEALDSPTPRFWKLLTTNDKAKPSMSTVSIGPNPEEEYDRAYLEEQLPIATDARDFSFLAWWEHQIVSNKSSISTHFQSIVVGAVRYPRGIGPYCLFANSPHPNLVLLQVLKHAMSDLQHDLRLARAVLLLIADSRLIDDDCSTPQTETSRGLETLRRLLTVISSEYIHCDGLCHERYFENGGVNRGAPDGEIDDQASHNNEQDHESIELEETSNEDNDEWEHHNGVTMDDSRTLESPNHYCSDWWQFLGSVGTCIAYGIEFMTEKHASVICAFVLREIDLSLGAFIPESIEKGGAKNESSGSGEASYKSLLKQNLLMFRELRVNLLIALVNGVKQHALMHRRRLKKYSHEETINQNSAKRSIVSFNICLGAIVDIGERVLLKLPTNNTSSLFGGAVARAMLEVHLETEILEAINVDRLYVAHEANFRLRSMIDPLRYANAISKAHNNPLLDLSLKRTCDVTSLEQLNTPSQDEVDVVKGLFMRDLIDLRISGFGFGDFLVWFRLPISPSELNIFTYINNFPSQNENRPDIIWATDEDGKVLSFTGLAARYDFTLMLLMREWNAPWTPSSHLSYSIPFRSAVKELALCAYRFSVPSGIVAAVNSFLPRSWWSDDRDSCWCRDCQLLCLKYKFKEKILARQSNWSDYDTDPLAKSQRATIPSSFIKCKCNIALACSNDHLRFLHQEGHKRCCGWPPFRTLTEKDQAFIIDVLEEGSPEKVHDEEFEEDGDDQEDDGDWESVSSNEEQFTDTKTDKIIKYLQDNSYRHTRREVLPFEDFF